MVVLPDGMDFPFAKIARSEGEQENERERQKRADFG
jgi:hypothetical protein